MLHLRNKEKKELSSSNSIQSSYDSNFSEGAHSFVYVNDDISSKEHKKHKEK
jgi:hypothetical protein